MYDGRPPLFTRSALELPSLRACFSWSSGVFSLAPGWDSRVTPSFSAETFGRAAPASTSGMTTASGACRTAWISLSASLLALSLSSRGEYVNGCLRNWHCRQTEKAREVGLTELTVGAVGRNGARTGVDVVRVMCMLDRIDCRNSNGMDCMTESSAWRRKSAQVVCWERGCRLGRRLSRSGLGLPLIR
jgi:hypothetical protein